MAFSGVRISWHIELMKAVFIFSLSWARRLWRCASSLAAMNCVRASFSRRTIACW